MSLIVDTSVALSWCFPDETTPETERLYAMARTEQLLVPPLWHVEMANALGMALKRQRISLPELQEILDALEKLDIHTVAPSGALTVQGYVSALRRYQLTAYDATYVLLAEETGLPLATFDGEMIAAAQRSGITLIRV